MWKRIRGVYWLIVPILAGLGSYFIATGQLGQVWRSIIRQDPIIDYPARLDLGVREVGDQAVGQLTIANRGAAELVIDQFRTNCSCTGLEQEREGRFIRMDSIRLPAGEQIDLAVRVSVRGVPVGLAMYNDIWFRTNDPSQPECHMQVVVRRVSGGIFTTPPSFVFGSVPLGAEVRQVLDVRDKAVSPRSIGRVTCEPNDRLTVRMLPIEERSSGVVPHPDGVLIGQIEVIVLTDSPGEVNGSVRIHLGGDARAPDTVAVAGRILARFEMNPSVLILPRQSSNGPVYSAQSIIRSTQGELLSLKVDPTAAGMTVEVLREGDPSSRVVRVTWHPQSEAVPPTGQRQRIRCRAKSATDEVVLELEVILQP